VHDTTWFEIQGKPAVFIASTEFVTAAEAQSKALGLPDVRRIFVPHPIQDRTDDGLGGVGDSAFDEIVARMTAAQ